MRTRNCVSCWLRAGWSVALLAGAARAQLCQDWVRTFGGSADEHAFGGADAAGTLRLAGVTTSFGAVGEDLLLLTYDPGGGLSSAIRWAGNEDEFIEGGGAVDAAGTVSAGGSLGPVGSAAPRDAFVLEFAPGGTLAWAARWDAGHGGEDEVDVVSVDAVNGFVYASGWTRNLAGDQDVLILKFDRAGALQGAVSWDTGGEESINGSDILFGPGGEVSLYVVGNHAPPGFGSVDALVMKYDVSPGLAVPQLVWARSWASGDAFGVSVDPATGSAYVTGGTEAFLPGNRRDAFLLQVRPDGRLGWDVTWGGTGDDEPSVAVHAGAVYLSGYSDSPEVALAGGGEAFVLEYDAGSGDVLWGQVFGGCSADFLGLSSSSGALVASGVTSSYEGVLAGCAACPGLAADPAGTSWTPISGTAATVAGTASAVALTPVAVTDSGGSGDDVLLVKLVERGSWTNYCAVVPDSTCSPAVMRASGSTSIAVDDFTLSAELVPDQPFLFFHGPTRIQVPFGSGFRCVGGGIARLNPPATASAGLAQRRVDLAAAGIGPGEVHFQCWFRDPLAGPPFFGTSDGLSVTFSP